MAFYYRLIQNRMKGNKNNYFAKIYNPSTITEKEIMEHMVNQGATITMADVLAVLKALEKALLYFFTQGVNIRTRLFNFQLSIRGTFQSEDDYFNPNRHKLHVVCRPTKLLKKTLTKVKLQKINVPATTPVIERITDLNTNTVNTQITANNVILIEGSKLKIDLNDPRQGIFFIDENKNEIRPQQIFTNTSSRLLLSLPPDIAGPVEVEIRVPAFKDRDIKFFRFPHKLKVRKPDSQTSSP
ncbi:DNA-binding domain-containing protein [Thermophagus xiamenensis]|uniref:Uncharacterized protein n=1 Tax=Thermophagus xiamenensis TaxID=385682 RepID=A0A1I2DV14_9BACT|nr:DNA-binding domain-containing protein [Thermophagus xiamenensis]SFE84209.1 protein of unknown function [Thermophagus xiamenensis]